MTPATYTYPTMAILTCAGCGARFLGTVYASYLWQGAYCRPACRNKGLA